MNQNKDELIDIKFNFYGMEHNSNSIKILNTETLKVYPKDSIQDIKRMLSLKLFKKLENDEEGKICKYCFKSKVSVSSQPSPLKKSKTPSVKPLDTKTPLHKKLVVETPVNDMDDEEDEFNLDSKMDNTDFDNFEDDFDQMDMEDQFKEYEEYMFQGGAKKRCLNCKKIYKANRQFFPIPTLFYLWDGNNDNYIKRYENEKEGIQIGHSFQVKRAKTEYVEMNYSDTYNFYNPFTLLTKFMDNDKFKILKRDFKSNEDIYQTFIKKVDSNIFPMFELLQMNIDGNKIKHGENKSEMYLKRLRTDNLLLLSDYYDFSKKTDITINLGYLPEFCYLHKYREIGVENILYNLYWPFVNFQNYYDHYFESGSKASDFEYLTEKTIKLWRQEIDEYKNIILHMNDIQIFSNALDRLYTTKIYLRINANFSTIQYINFSNIYHSFKLDKEIPYLTTYVPEEGMFLERMYYPMRKLPDQLNWPLIRKEILQFYLKLPFQSNIKGEKPTDIYFQVNLYENKQIDVNIPLRKDYRINLNDWYDKDKKIKKIDKVIECVNKLIDRLNKMEGGIFNNAVVEDNGEKLEFSTPDNTEILNINFMIDFKIRINEEVFLNNFDNLNKCLYPFFYTDYKKLTNIDSRKEYRYKRFNNYKNATEIDKFLYVSLQNIEHKSSEKIKSLTKKERLEITRNVMEIFKITYTEASILVKRFSIIYFSRDRKMKPIMGTLFYFALIPDIIGQEKTINIRANSLGVRNFEEMNMMGNFLNRLVSLLYHLTHKNKVSNKKFLKAIEYFQKNPLCGEEIKDKFILEDKEKIKKLDSINVRRVKEYMSCNFRISEIKNNKKNKNKYKDELKKLTKRRNELYKLIDTNSEDFKAKKVLKNAFPNLRGKNYKVQGLNQPIGTGLNPPPHRFVRFNYDNEIQKFKDWPKPQINQKGGGLEELTKEFYETYHEKIDPQRKVYIGRRELSKCNKGKGDFGYNKDDLRKMMISLGMSATKVPKSMSKKVLCKLIKKYISKNEDGDTEDLSSIDISVDIDANTMKKKFRQLGTNLTFDEDKSKIEKVFKQKNVRQFLLENLNNINDKIYEKLLKLLKLQEANSILDSIYKVKKERVEIIKTRMILEIHKMDDEWNNREIKYFYNALYPNEKNDNPELRRLLVKTFFKDFENTFMKFDTEETFLSTNLQKKHLDNFWDTIKEKEILAINDFDMDGNPGGIVKQSSLNFFGRALSCPNYTHHLNVNHKNRVKNEGLIEYLEFDSYDIDEYENRNDTLRKMICHPTCHGKQKVKEELITDRSKLRYLFCAGEMNYRTFRSIDDKIKKNETKNYVYSIGINNPGSLGKLPDDLHYIFNHFDRYLKNINNISVPSVFYKTKSKSQHTIQSPSFVLIGTNKGRKNIIEVMGLLIGLSKEKMKIKLIKHISSNKKLFSSLNQGILIFKFKKSLLEYFEYIINDYQQNTTEWVLDLFSRPGILHKKGVNIIIFKENRDKDIIIKSYKDLFIEDYYDKNRPNIYLYEHEEGYVEPIILKFPNSDKIYGIFDPEDDNFKYDKMTKKQYNQYIKGLNNFIGDWAYKNFNKKEEFPLLTAKETLNLMDPEDERELIQLVDSFHKVLYIIDEKQNLIPVKPSGFYYGRKLKYFNSKNEIIKYAKSFNETKSYLSEFTKKYINKIKINKDDLDYLKSFYKPKKLIQDRKHKNKYIAIELNKNIIIPIKSFNKKTLPISLNFIEYDINEALFQKDNEKANVPVNKQIIKDEYNTEIYNRYLLELSSYLHNHKKVRSQLFKFIQSYQKYTRNKVAKVDANQRQKYRKRINKLVSYIFYKLTIPEYNLFDTITKEKLENKKIKNKNRRRACSLYQNSKSCNSDTYCKFDNITNKCRIHIPIEKVNTIIGKITEEFIMNSQVAKNLLNNNIDTIIDRFLFDEEKEVNGMIYRKRAE